MENYTTEDCKVVKYVCTLVSARAAFLAAAGEQSCAIVHKWLEGLEKSSPNDKFALE